MKKQILKWFGIDLDYYSEIKKYNAAQEKQNEMLDFKICEDKIKASLLVYKNIDEKVIERVLEVVRNYSEDGFPITRYKQLSDKYKLYDKDKYKASRAE